jgi:UDPglucose 6-dehydrogenase
MARIAVVGLWHLGCVVSAALASLGHIVSATDFDNEVVRNLQRGVPPVYEPGLAELMALQISKRKLAFLSSCSEAFANAEYIFITFDTPVDENDQSDLTPVETALDAISVHARSEVQIVVMSQVPVGTCQRLRVRLREHAPGLSFTLLYQPENLRLGEALKTFLHPDLIIVGSEDELAAERFLRLYEGIEAPRLAMSWNSAEMAKHALNAFLAASISFINELADLAEATRADVRDVVRALRLDRRIGPHAFLSPGAGFSGGTLARDIQTLRLLGKRLGCTTCQLDATVAVNTGRLPSIAAKIHRLCGEAKGSRVGLLGLTYKPGTDTLRRSNALALTHLLTQLGSKVHAFDPHVSELPAGIEGIVLCSDPYEVAQGARAIVVMTPWPEFKKVDFARLASVMQQPLIIDVPNCLDESEIRSAGLHYVGTGFSEGPMTRRQTGP